MSKYNLDDYATVDERISAFYQQYEDGRIITDRVTDDPTANVEVFKAFLYRTPDEQSRNLPMATGFALEIRDEELQISKQGYEYASVNYSAWLENCETSAIGRALANAGFTGNKNRPSREEMEKVKRQEEKGKSSSDNTPTNKKEAKPKPKKEEKAKPEPQKDDSDSSQSADDILKEIKAINDKTELVKWWKAHAKDDEYKQYKEQVFNRLGEL